MMRRFRVRLTRQAEEDLIAIWLNIAGNDPAAADRVLDRLDRRIDSLADMPLRGAPRAELGRGIRLLIEASYLIVYRAEADGVTVIRLVHGARDVADLFKP